MRCRRAPLQLVSAVALLLVLDGTVCAKDAKPKLPKRRPTPRRASFGTTLKKQVPSVLSWAALSGIALATRPEKSSLVQLLAETFDLSDVDDIPYADGYLCSLGEFDGLYYLGLFHSWVPVLPVTADAARKMWELLSEFHRFLYVNVVIYLFWKILPRRFMEHHFTTSYDGTFGFNRRPWNLITAAFSHANMLHMAKDLYMLHFIMPVLTMMFGSLKTLGMYVSAAVAASTLNAVVKRIRKKQWQPFLSSSAALTGTILAHACLAPEDRHELGTMPGSDMTAVLSPLQALLAHIVIDLCIIQHLPFVTAMDKLIGHAAAILAALFWHPSGPASAIEALRDAW